MCCNMVISMSLLLDIVKNLKTFLFYFVCNHSRKYMSCSSVSKYKLGFPHNNKRVCNVLPNSSDTLVYLVFKVCLVHKSHRRPKEMRTK